LLAASQFGFERTLHRRIGRQFALRQEFIVFHEQFGLQNMEPVKFAEQICRGVGHRSERIFRMRLLPRSEGFMRLGELQIVHVAVTLIQAGCPEGNAPKRRNR
jgi:hypothetical protein